MIEPARLDLVLREGEDYELIFKDFEYPINGYTFEADILSEIDQSVVASFSSAVDEVNGTLTLRLTSLDANDLDIKSYDWYLRQIDTTFFKTRLVEGKLTKKN